MGSKTPATRVESQFKVVLDTVSDGVTVLDTDLNIQFQNRAISQWFGSRIGEHCFEAYRGRTTPCEACLVAEVLKDGKSRTGIRDVALPSGDVLLIEFSSAALKNEDGKIIGAVEVARDVTRQKKAEALMNQTLLDRNQALKRLNEELSDAAGYVKTVLPPPITSGPLLADWRFIPSASLGGDSFGYHWIDEDHFGMYLIDVSGHGWAAALLSVSVVNVLRSQALPLTDFRDPQQVLSALNRAFPGEKNGDMFFTIWYGVYHKVSHQLVYASAGHPPALLLAAPVPAPGGAERLRTANTVIGSGLDVEYQMAVKVIQSPSRLYVFSDGVYDVMTADGAVWGFNALSEFLTKPSPVDCSPLDDLLSHVYQLNPREIFEDDFTILEISFR